MIRGLLSQVFCLDCWTTIPLPLFSGYRTMTATTPKFLSTIVKLHLLVINTPSLGFHPINSLLLNLKPISKPLSSNQQLLLLNSTSFISKICAKLIELKRRQSMYKSMYKSMYMMHKYLVWSTIFIIMCRIWKAIYHRLRNSRLIKIQAHYLAFSWICKRQT